MRILDPNRDQYQRVYQDEHQCVFCGGDTTIPCEELHTEHWSVIVNKYPYMDGNLMIVSKRHVEQLTDLSPEEWADLHKAIQQTQAALAKAFSVESFNIGINLGPESGASISHIHWQIVPRKFKNVTVLNTFADLHLVAVSPEETRCRISAVCQNMTDKPTEE
jgi:diadenosine tetraphosphate (Ap4A) HIT family hydrolase